MKRIIIIALLLTCKLTLVSQESIHCIDLSDLNAPHIHCTYGNFYNPYMNEGVVDYGQTSDYSRHTVITTQGTDERTGNSLQLIPPGEEYCVRLGNWWVGAEAESITCDFTVDTLEADILILKYAAVMEEPGHVPEHQPRFTFIIGYGQ